MSALLQNPLAPPPYTHISCLKISRLPRVSHLAFRLPGIG